MYFHSSQENFSWLLTFYNLGFRTLGYACCFWNEWFGWKKGLCLLGDLASSSIAEKSSQNKHCGTRDCTATCSLSHSHERSFPFPFLCWRKWNMTARFLSFTHKLPWPHPLPDPYFYLKNEMTGHGPADPDLVSDPETDTVKNVASMTHFSHTSFLIHKLDIMS